MHKNNLMRRLAAALVVAATTVSAHATVTESTPSGFAVEITAHIAASPDKTYAALVDPARWWNSQHTFSNNASNLSLNAKAGGCLCEKLANGGSVQHLIVTVVIPGRTLRLRGAMGPLQGQGVDSALTFTLTAKDGGTELKLENNVGGYIKGGIGKWPPAVDSMLTDLVAHLKTYCETGKN
jgi:uncharacterized protein YndB with AHSA1/START domain